MLVLTRKTGERVFIGPNITVTVVSIFGNKVRLGLTAPTDVNILREELSPVLIAVEPEVEERREEGKQRK